MQSNVPLLLMLRTPITGDYLLDHNKRSWANTPNSVKEDYGEEYFNAFLSQMEKSLQQARPNVDEVTIWVAEIKLHCSYIPMGKL